MLVALILTLVAVRLMLMAVILIAFTPYNRTNRALDWQRRRLGD